MQRQAAEDERIDSILAKVGSSGIDSLSRGEMRFLRRTSRGLEGSRRRGLGQLVGAIRPRSGGPGGVSEREAASRRGPGRRGPPHGEEILDPPIEPEELLQPGDPLEELLEEPTRDPLAPDAPERLEDSAGEPVNWDEMFEREGWLDVDDGPVEGGSSHGEGEESGDGGGASEGGEGKGPADDDAEDDDGDPSRPDASAH